MTSVPLFGHCWSLFSTACPSLRVGCVPVEVIAAASRGDKNKPPTGYTQVAPFTKKNPPNLSVG